MQGQYSYNIFGNNLKYFIQGVIQKPTLVAGLSSSGVLTIWLSANLLGDILPVISDDLPIFSSFWPRIQDEIFMNKNFGLAIEISTRLDMAAVTKKQPTV